MPSILSDADKETVKRTVPKPANKIHAVAVARLYVAYPDPQKWTYTGLQGAVVLANDLVGRTFWLKLVDVSVSNCVCLDGPLTFFSPRLLMIPFIPSHSPLDEVLSGTRRSTIISPITKTEHSFTRLSWKSVLLVYPLLMRKKLKRSSRKCKSGRKMRAKKLGRHLLHPLVVKAPLP